MKMAYPSHSGRRTITQGNEYAKQLPYLGMYVLVQNKLFHLFGMSLKIDFK